MAAVVRVKRRRNEDPVETLMISCKRRKNDPADSFTSDGNDKCQVESVLKYAATITTKDVTVSKHIRDAIRKEKLEKEYKHHGYGGNVTARNRHQHQVVSRSNRYKILNSYRTQGLDDLDAATADSHTSNPPDVIGNDCGTKTETVDATKVRTTDVVTEGSSTKAGTGDVDKVNTTDVVTENSSTKVSDATKLCTNGCQVQTHSKSDECACHEVKKIHTAGCTHSAPLLSDPEKHGHHGNCKGHPCSACTLHSECTKNINHEKICVHRLSGECCKEQVTLSGSTCTCSSPPGVEGTTSLTCGASSDDKSRSSSSHELDMVLVESPSSLQSSDKVFCLYDVEKENVVDCSPAVSNNNNNNVQAPSSLSEFTCNSVPMIREVVGHSGEPDEDYVYDLYYTNSSSVDFRLFENILRIEALQEDAVVDERLDWSDDEVRDDDDDSNEENNWRNDYPNEDPHFYENVDAEYYGDDGVGNHMFNEEEPLSEWMSSRCNIEDDGDDSNDESPPSQYDPLFGPTATYEQYLKRIHHEVDSLDD
ncbi:probable RNA polymerase II nuclear localization protein SLC7A6OS [Gigantopelta aegis]|uniref:probable RNA polymerase II nuclear localization protein SLC7A6OS n=1 Tax=Gigantopelta aegis TaxID=1735272 RepID=UPI001B8887FE|nr:probable RNA polymerase II nuclear localization protein SLC7A6OS [Gigantopelta aegis]